jgi:hypothetical protein
LQELELDLKKNQQDVEATGKDIDRCLVVLRAAADRLAPGAVVRVIVRKQEVAVRDLATADSKQRPMTWRVKHRPSKFQKGAGEN